VTAQRVTCLERAGGKCFKKEVARGGHRSRVDFGRILRFSFRPGSKVKICENPDPGSLFNFGSSRSLHGHFLSKNIGKFRLDRWQQESEQEADSQI